MTQARWALPPPCAARSYVPIPNARECKRLTNAKPDLARPNCRTASCGRHPLIHVRSAAATTRRKRGSGRRSTAGLDVGDIWPVRPGDVIGLTGRPGNPVSIDEFAQLME